MNLDEELNNEKDGFVLCLNYFSSGLSRLKLQFGSKDGETADIGISFYECERICQVYYFVESYFTDISQENSNSWVHVCFQFNLLDQNIISIAINNKMKHKANLGDTHQTVLSSLKSINIWMEKELHGNRYLEKITLINIYNLDKDADGITCGESGNIYKWAANDWTINATQKDFEPTITTESTHIICTKDTKLVKLPELDFQDAVESCSKVNGRMFFEEDSFRELIFLEGERNEEKSYFWIPFTDVYEEGILRNIYNNATVLQAALQIIICVKKLIGITNFIHFEIEKNLVFDLFSQYLKSKYPDSHHPLLTYAAHLRS